MQTYELDPSDLKRLRRMYQRRNLLGSSIVFLGYLALNFHQGSIYGSNLVGRWIEATLTAAVFSGIIWTLGSDRLHRYELLVDEQAICAILDKGSHSVLRGQIRSIWEKKDGLYLSERAGLQARIFGRVWIPKELGEYEAMKDLATSWKWPSPN